MSNLTALRMQLILCVALCRVKVDGYETGMPSATLPQYHTVPLWRNAFAVEDQRFESVSRSCEAVFPVFITYCVLNIDSSCTKSRRTGPLLPASGEKRQEPVPAEENTESDLTIWPMHEKCHYDGCRGVN